MTSTKSATGMTSTNPATNLSKIIAVSSVGTILEWYDLYLFGSLATVMSTSFFPKTYPGAALLYTIALFGAGILMRPIGALVFGRLGDSVGRKSTFVMTLTIMGISTFAIGIIPGYERIGIAAPLLLLALRLLQGLAVGGEYGGAATYVAEYAPVDRRGYFTSWIQASTSMGLLLSLGVILLTRYALDADHATSIEKFNAWGWRIPFLLSIALVGISLYIRLKMQESPLFCQLKTEGRLSANPLTESFGRKDNLKKVLLALFGAAMGQGVIFYAGQFYARSFLGNVCMVDFDQSGTMMLIAIVLATPFFILFGRWSDRIGRKWIMLAGMLLAILTYPFLFGQLLKISGTQGRTELTGQKEIRTSAAFINKTRNMIRSSAALTYYEDGMIVTETQKDTVYASGKAGGNVGGKAGKSVTTVSKSLNTADYRKIVAILFVMVFSVTIVSGPITAWLINLFPTRIRYTSLSLPYQIGNGVFGGLIPIIATLLTTKYTGHALAGIWYPIGVAAIGLVIGAIFIPGGKRAGRGDASRSNPQGEV
jgi:MFS family permease